MSQSIDLGKLRFHFAGDWSDSATYEPNDIVKYGGSVYVYTYLLKTAGNVPTNTVYWALMVEGISAEGVWNAEAVYVPGDLVAYGGNTFICLTAHASGVFATDLSEAKWQKFNSGVRWRGAWRTGTNYVVDDIISNGLSTYICKADHTSGTFATDLTAVKWELMVLGQSVLPVQTGQNGKVLKTDGTDPYWATDPLTAPAVNNRQKIAISDGTSVVYDAFPLNAMYVAAQ